MLRRATMHDTRKTWLFRRFMEETYAGILRQGALIGVGTGTTSQQMIGAKQKEDFDDDPCCQGSHQAALSLLRLLEALRSLQTAVHGCSARCESQILGHVLMNAQVESPLSGANRKTFLVLELCWS
jgi:hypothetical protein